jgi:hypothetical protein
MMNKPGPIDAFVFNAMTIIIPIWMNALDNKSTDVIKLSARDKAEIYLYVKVKVKLSLCLLNLAPRYEDVWGSGGVTP